MERTGSGQALDTLTREQFLRYLRDGLNHLQDPTFLRRSPLVGVFGVANRFATPVEVQRILIEAIQALEPQPDAPADSRAWRMYEALYYRYVERYDQENVAQQLGMSVRQVRREQKAALEALSYHLWEQYNLETRRDLSSPAGGTRYGPASNFLEEEFSWLKDLPSDDPADLDVIIPSILDLAKPMAIKHGILLHNQIKLAQNKVAVNSIAMRQILLNVMGVAIPRTAASGKLNLTAVEQAAEVRLQIKCLPPLRDAKPLSTDEQKQANIAEYLLRLYGGRLEALDAGGSAFFLTLPVLEQLPVMVVDDNESALQLFHRYASGSRYRLVSVRDPADVVTTAEKIAPQIILLDVMMPRMDGWEILGRLHSHSFTSRIPVIVCTIMAQEELALSLGAAGFLQKPVTRQAFLAALDQQIDRMGSTSH